MSHDITVTFLGTTSGGGPTQTRNCSSLVADLAGDGSLWMFDCAEGTVRQFENQPYRPGYQRVRVNQVSKIFITHMHADHTMGILTFLRNILGIPKPVIDPDAPPANKSSTKVEIFGPRGIRRMIRMLWNVTHTRSSQAYIVHELLFPGEQPSVPAEVRAGEGADETDVRNASEKVGRDIHCDEAGYWPRIVNREIGGQRGCGLIVDAGPIQHRDPCIGYVIREVPREPLTAESPLPRKLVILGDTYDPSPLAPLVHDEPPFASPLPERDPWGHDVPVKIPVSLLVHEATDAHIPAHVDPSGRTGKNRTPESVREKAISRGHSTPGMAGAFARTIAAERLVMNHIGARFPAPVGELTNMSNPQTKLRHGIVREMARQAAEGWCPDGSRPVHTEVAVDFHVVTIRPNRNAPTAPGPLPYAAVAREEETMGAAPDWAAGLPARPSWTYGDQHTSNWHGPSDGGERKRRHPSSSSNDDGHRSHWHGRGRGRDNYHDRPRHSDVQGDGAWRDDRHEPSRSRDHWERQ